MATIINGVTSYMVYDAGGKLVAEYGQAPPSTNGTQYVFSDHQGSTRVVMKQSGEVVSRQDYEPFGGELGAIGLRSQDQFYGLGSSARQKYTGMEKDEGSNLDHTLWRKFESSSGRWTSPDPYGGSMSVGDPQSFNRYSYVNNDPVNQTDALGLMAGADQGYGGFEGWGDDLTGGGSHFGGPGIIAEAEARHDRYVENDMNGGEYGEEEQQQQKSIGQQIEDEIGPPPEMPQPQQVQDIETVKIDKNVHRESPKILDFNVRYINKVKGSGEVPIGGKFQITYKYRITKPGEGEGTPSDYGIIGPIKSTGTFTSAEGLGLVKVDSKIIGVKGEAVEVQKTEIYMVKTDQKNYFSRGATTRGINFRIIVREPKSAGGQVVEAKSSNSSKVIEVRNVRIQN